MRVLYAIVISLLLSGCLAIGQRPNPYAINRAQGFDLWAVRGECARLQCEDPNVVVARHFARIAERHGGACIVHLFPEDSGPPPHFWRQYLWPLLPMAHRAELDLYSYSGAEHRQGKVPEQATIRLFQTEGFYRSQGVQRGQMNTHFVRDPKAVVPPYQLSQCAGLPVVEWFEGARIVTSGALPSAEGATSGDRVGRTVIAVVRDNRR